MMATEFHNLDLVCSPGSIIPSGLGYSDPTYQSCAIAGSTPGSLTLSGDAYVAASFGFSYGHVWRNLGILLLFTVVFIGLGAWFSEIFEWEEGSNGAIEYKKTATLKSSTPRRDVEEEAVSVDDRSPPATTERRIVKDDAPVNLDTGTSTFTWHDLTYNIPYDGSTKTLLNNVSGYCEPATMTALVGSSGAGKTTCKYAEPIQIQLSKRI